MIINEYDRKENNHMQSIFTPPPPTWGSRGNPYFWDYLEAHIPEDITVDNLEQWIKDEHKHLTGQELNKDSSVYVEQFSHGGMSSGVICGSWWFETGIPVLKERLASLTTPVDM